MAKEWSLKDKIIGVVGAVSLALLSTILIFMPKASLIEKTGGPDATAPGAKNGKGGDKNKDPMVDLEKKGKAFGDSAKHITGERAESINNGSDQTMSSSEDPELSDKEKAELEKLDQEIDMRRALIRRLEEKMKAGGGKDVADALKRTQEINERFVFQGIIGPSMGKEEEASLKKELADLEKRFPPKHLPKDHSKHPEAEKKAVGGRDR